MPESQCSTRMTSVRRVSVCHPSPDLQWVDHSYTGINPRPLKNLSCEAAIATSLACRVDEARILPF